MFAMVSGLEPSSKRGELFGKIMFERRVWAGSQTAEEAVGVISAEPGGRWLSCWLIYCAADHRLWQSLA